MSGPFDSLVERYEAWYEDHPDIFNQEIALLRTYWPTSGLRLELGSGTGRFGASLGVEIGCEPSAPMNARAVERLPAVVRGVGEALPFHGEAFDAVLAVGVLAFLEDIEAVLGEVRRVLVDRGHLLLGFIDSRSPLGRRYAGELTDDPFYRAARFHSAAELEELVRRGGFETPFFAQTLLGPPERPLALPGCVQGSGRGGFSCLVARKAPC
ncbi:MAG: methyltransferase domain-containing protein [Candidatus Coatesbacteria bacterium]|nr:methyltransferase domain-containing protein [Candidatus Coatesbacteria bacterium]